MNLKKSLLSLVLFIALFLVKLSPFNYLLHSKIWIIFAFFIALDFLVKMLIEQAMSNKRENFVQFYLASVVLRFILILAFLAFGFYKFKDNQNLFVLNVFAFYLFFTIFEISILLRKLRRF
jgi:asparagine N-glycosylation enzyme membrane subunit Stt3